MIGIHGHGFGIVVAIWLLVYCWSIWSKPDKIENTYNFRMNISDFEWYVIGMLWCIIGVWLWIKPYVLPYFWEEGEHPITSWCCTHGTSKMFKHDAYMMRT